MNTITFDIKTRDGFYLEDVEIPVDKVVVHRPRIVEYPEKSEFWGQVATHIYKEAFWDSVEIENDGWIASCEALDDDQIADLIMERANE